MADNRLAFRQLFANRIFTTRAAFGGVLTEFFKVGTPVDVLASFQRTNASFYRNYNAYVKTGRRIRSINTKRDMLYQCADYKVKRCCAYFQLERLPGEALRLSRFRMTHNHVIAPATPGTQEEPRDSVPMTTDHKKELEALFGDRSFRTFAALKEVFTSFEEVGSSVVR